MPVSPRKLSTPLRRTRALLALEDYFAWSLALRQVARHGARASPGKKRFRSMLGPKARVEVGYIAHWFAALHVVIEGWRELGLSDPTVDKLLRMRGKVDALRRFRNAVYHYQIKGAFDRRFDAILQNEARIAWANRLTDELLRVFHSLPRRRVSVHDWLAAGAPASFPRSA